MKPLDDDQVAERLFRGLAPPQPPPDLRERVLRTGDTRVAAAPRADVWTRIWGSRGLRLAWAASVLLLLGGNLLLVPIQSESSHVVAESFMDEEIADFLRPMRITDTAFPNIGRSGGGRHELVALDEGGNAS